MRINDLKKKNQFRQFEGIFHLLAMIFGCDYIVVCFQNTYKKEYVEDIIPVGSQNINFDLTPEALEYEILRKAAEANNAILLDSSAVKNLGLDKNYSVMACPMENGSFIKGVLAVVSEKPNAWSPKDVEKLSKTVHLISEYNTLKEYKQYTDTIIESIDTAIFAVSTLGTLVTFNRAAERILGCSSAGVIGKHYFALMAHQERERMRLSVDYVIRTGNTYRGNFVEMTRLDNKIIYTNILVCPWINNNGEIIGAIAVVTDETENKRFQDKLIRTEKMAVLGQITAQVSPENDKIMALMDEVMNGFAATDNGDANDIHPGGIVGHSPAMNTVFKMINKIASHDTTVLITGESGTGKTLLAQAVHDLSGRKAFPLVTVNCAALPENLLESELFGHEKGAFTGAVSARTGKFELAKKGTIFLDEISTLSLQTQAKLLRVIQEKKFEKVGGEKTIEVDVRIIAATNEKLENAVAKGTFREDLFYRLNVFTIEMPPLRERKEDIPYLVDYFIKKFNHKINKNIIGVTGRSMDLLINYAWPGNVRELQNVIERAVILEDDIQIGEDSLPGNLHLNKGTAFNGGLKESNEVNSGAAWRRPLRNTPDEVIEGIHASAAAQGNLHSRDKLQDEALDEGNNDNNIEDELNDAINKAEKTALIKALKTVNGNRAQAADLLGISIRSLQYKLKKHGLIKFGK